MRDDSHTIPLRRSGIAITDTALPQTAFQTQLNDGRAT